MFGTVKSIMLYKGKPFSSAMCSTLATAMYALSLLFMFRDNSIGGLIALCAATFIGSYLPAKAMDKLEKDKLYVYEITSNTLETGKEFADILRECNIPVSTLVIHDKNLNKVLFCKAYSQTKADSRIIKSLMPDTFKLTIISSVIVKE